MTDHAKMANDRIDEVIAIKQSQEDFRPLRVFGRIDYANPTVAQMLIAAPALQWRRCYNCNFIGLYVNGTLPDCRCHECESADTRLMRKDTAKLNGMAKEGITMQDLEETALDIAINEA